MKDLCPLLEEQGVDMFYSTPAEQLVMDGQAVTGVVARTADGYTQFNATKGVVLATGDCQNDREMAEYYLPDVKNLELKKTGRTDDGHKMAVWAGGQIENIGHTKMAHDFDSGPASMCDMPFLRVRRNGRRFANETVGMDLMNCYLQGEEDRGHYYQIFDSEYMRKGADFPGELVDPEAFAQTVSEYNAMAENGKDTEFGVPAKYLRTVDSPPYYGIHRHVRLTMACSGVEVNGDLQCVTPEGEPIKGLYAIGNCAGNFYGGVDYPLTIFGLSLGHNCTEG